jgi:hopanoid biosynthesis associated RND transporter like protein HpnN
MTRVQRTLRIILAAQTAHPFLILLIALTLAGLSVFYTVRNLEFHTSQKALISPKQRLLQLTKLLDPFDEMDTFVVAIENRDTSRSLAFLRALVPHLEADKEHYVEVFYRVDPQAFRAWALLYLDEKELRTLKGNLQEHQQFMQGLAESPHLNNLLSEINHEMASKMVGELFTGFLEDSPSDDDGKPVDLRFLIRMLKEMIRWIEGNRSFSSPWESFFGDESWDNYDEGGYFWTENKRYLLIFLTPQETEEGFTDSLQSLRTLRQTIAQVQADFPEINVGVTGQEALNQDEMGMAFHDMSLATGISIIGLTILLALFWRGLRRPILEIIELLVALSWTFGLTTLFIGHLNILSVTFAPLLLGLGIDYGIHWFARYQETEQVHAISKREAIEDTMIRLGPGIALAGLTAALSFFPLVLTGFTGLVELGIITSIGMVMTTITTLCLLPALTLLFDRPLHRSRLATTGSQKYFLRLNNARALIFLIPGVGLSALSLWAAGGVRFDLNMLKLQSKSAESVIWEKKLLGDSQRSSMYGAVLAHTLEEVREKAKALEALPTVSEVQSVMNLLPGDQEDKISFLREMKPLLKGIGCLRRPEGGVDLTELDEQLGKIRFKMQDSNDSQWGVNKPLAAQMIEVRTLIDQLRTCFKTTDRARLLSALAAFEDALVEDLNDQIDLLRVNMNTRPIQLDDLPKSLLQRFVGANGLYLIRVFPAQNIWEPVLLKSFVSDLQSVDPDAIGDPVTLFIFTKAFRDACIRAAVYAVIFIFVLLLLTYHKFIYTGLVMMPLIVGTVWTLGLMRVFRVDFNLANSIFLPLIVGAGVEYGIIIVQRWWQRRGRSGDVALPFSTAKGVILAGLTTTVGFGSLTISDHQGIHSLGLLAVIGSLSILAAAVFFLPALLQVIGNFARGEKM